MFSCFLVLLIFCSISVLPFRIVAMIITPFKLVWFFYLIHLNVLMLLIFFFLFYLLYFFFSLYFFLILALSFHSFFYSFFFSWYLFCFPHFCLYDICALIYIITP